MKWAWLLLACAIASRTAMPATVAAAEAAFALHVVGTTSAVSVQLAHDLAAMMALVLLSLLSAPSHRLANVAFVVAGGLLLAVAEPMLSARFDTVAAAWQLPRVVGRLSAALFAITSASYADLLAERPRGAVRTFLRTAIGACLYGLAYPLTYFGRAGFRMLALLLGIDARWEDVPPRAFIFEPQTLLERIAVLAAWPLSAPFPAQWRAEVLAAGATPEAVLFVAASHGAWLPGRYTIR